jgi:hypothetical protein
MFLNSREADDAADYNLNGKSLVFQALSPYVVNHVGVATRLN